ncbi:hypothetical protein GEMRC1_010247 [Eukaryota sp. GEM-RC1]
MAANLQSCISETPIEHTVTLELENGTSLEFNVPSASKLSELKLFVESQTRIPQYEQVYLDTALHCVVGNKRTLNSCPNTSLFYLFRVKPSPTNDVQTVFIANSMTRKYTTFTISTTASLSDLRSLIQQQFNLDPDEQRLVTPEAGYSVRVLRGNGTLKDFGVSHLSLLWLTKNKRDIRLKFNVETLTHKKFPIEATENMIAYEAKLLIQAKEGVPPDQQRLVFAGRLLDDLESLVESGICHNATVHLVLRLRGGKPVIVFRPPLDSSWENVCVESHPCLSIFRKEGSHAITWRDLRIDQFGHVHHPQYPPVASLFWESESSEGYSVFADQFANSTVVLRQQAALVLHQNLLAFGFKVPEATEMVTYWQPHMESLSSQNIELAFVNPTLIQKLATLQIIINGSTSIPIYRYFLVFRSTDRSITDTGLRDPYEGEFASSGRVNSVLEWGGMCLP